VACALHSPRDRSGHTMYRRIRSSHVRAEALENPTQAMGDGRTVISGEEGIGVGGGEGEDRVEAVGAGENKPDRRRGGGGSELCTRPVGSISHITMSL
jgi:hypothetical protein